MTHLPGTERPEWMLTPDQLALLSDDEIEAYLSALEIVNAEADLGWTLNDRQQVAEDWCDRLMAAGDPFELLYGGAGGGGKSEWLLWHLYQLALRFPGSQSLLLRTTFPELNRTAIIRAHMRFDTDLCKWRVNEKQWRFDNGSIIEFGYLETPRDVFQYDSAEYACVAWDELTQHPTDYPYRYLFSRLRVSRRQAIAGLTPHMIAGTNPHRVGAVWVKPRWIDVCPPEQPVPVQLQVGEDDEIADTRQVTRIFIPAKLADNPYIDAKAYRQGLAVLDNDLRKAIEDGNWDVIQGAFFPEWRRDVHVIEPFAIPSWWRRISGYDFGIANPAAHVWIAFDGDETAYVYREFYKRELTVGEQAKAIKNAEKSDERIDYRVADPSIWTRTGAGPPIANQFSDLGLAFRKANNARVDGWSRVRSFLRPSVPQGDGRQPKPRLFVFRTCPELIRTLPMLVHDDKNPEDCDTDGEDHLPDALRYALMSRPLKARQRVEEAQEARQGRMERRAPAYRRDRDPRNGTIEHPVLGRLER